jgi:putative PIN family toxin of toxin-antitoxin system
MKVVIDANVFISAAIQIGPSHRIIQEWLKNGSFEIIMCDQLLQEIYDVLILRARLRKWISIEHAHEFVEMISTLSDRVPDPTESPSVLRDIGDDYLVDLGRIHAVNFIVSGDKDLLEWVEQRPPVISPSQFATILRLNP